MKKVSCYDTPPLHPALQFCRVFEGCSWLHTYQRVNSQLLYLNFGVGFHFTHRLMHSFPDPPHEMMTHYGCHCTKLWCAFPPVKRYNDNGYTACATSNPQPEREVRREHQQARARPHRQGGGARRRSAAEQGAHRLLPLRGGGEQHRAGAEDVPNERAQFRGVKER